jgi:C_GCAxxG_C_C family probable redox protein
MVSFKNISGLSPVTKQGEKKLWDEFSLKEKRMIGKSDRAQKIIQIEGMSCAEKVLLTTIRSFNKPDEMVSVAASFGGGIKRGDLCGMLTGGFMSIGLGADVLYDNKEERSAFVKEKTAEFWNWWQERAEIHCADLREDYSGDREKYNRMIQRVALWMDEAFTL